MNTCTYTNTRIIDQDKFRSEAVDPLSAELRCTKIGSYQCPGRRPQGHIKNIGSSRSITFARWQKREVGESRSCSLSVSRSDFDLWVCLAATTAATIMVVVVLRSQTRLLQATYMSQDCPTELLLVPLRRQGGAKVIPARLRSRPRGFPR